MGGPPRYGTLLESLCIIVWKARQSLMIAGIRAQAQAALGGDAAIEAFKEFRDAVNRVEVEDTQVRMRERLKELGKMPPIAVTPLQAGTRGSKSLRRAVPALPDATLSKSKIVDFRPVRAKRRK
jgi:hypothetical protein